MADESTGERLRRAFGFDAEEVEINRLGRLSARQEAALSALRASRRQRTMIALGVMGLAILIPLLLMLSGLLGPRAQSTPLFFGVTAAIIVGLFFMGEIASFWRGGDLRAGKVSQVEGEATLSTTTAARIGQVYLAQIGQVRLRVPRRDQWETLDEGKRYRVFYIDNPPEPVILSIEPLDE
jgi:hypothetical protein